jgi:hypothetical protein
VPGKVIDRERMQDESKPVHLAPLRLQAVIVGRSGASGHA